MTLEQAAAIGVGIVGAVCLFVGLVWVSIEMWDNGNWYDSPIRKVLMRLAVLLIWMAAVTALVYFGSQPIGVG